MTPLEAAKRLADASIGVHCDFCTGSPISGHFEDCPLFAVPQIVAALEAAERMAAVEPDFQDEAIDDGQIVRRCAVCQWVPSPRFDGGHHPDCEYQALVVALEGNT